MDAKEAAGRKAAELVRDGMTLGLGTGTTSVHVIRAIGERVQKEGLRVRGVPTSERSRILAEEMGIPLVDLSEAGQLDLAIDGADEVDPDLNLLKGGGGALLREKLVAAASKEFVVICDDAKLKPHLGAFPLPVAVVPFGWKTTFKRLQQYGENIVLRPAQDGSGQPYVTDDGCYILDMHLERIADVPALERNIKQTTGVVEVGLFVGLASRVIMGFADGHTEERS